MINHINNIIKIFGGKTQAEQDQFAEKFDTLIWDNPPRITRIVFPEDKKTEESNFFEEGGTMETSKEKTGHHKNN